MPLSPVARVPRPSTWFFWQAHFIRPGARVLDLACGEGRHSLAAAALGAAVMGVDRDSEVLATARELAAAGSLAAEFREADLDAPWPHLGEFDAVLLFNYLDRPRMPDVVACLAPGGSLPGRGRPRGPRHPCRRGPAAPGTGAPRGPRS